MQIIIEKNDKFYCKKDYIMESGEIAYKKGKVYKSEIDLCLTDEQGDKRHQMCNDNAISIDEFLKHFKLVKK